MTTMLKFLRLGDCAQRERSHCEAPTNKLVMIRIIILGQVVDIGKDLAMGELC